MNYLITVSERAKAQTLEYARKLAQEYALEFIPREGRSISQLKLTFDGVFVLDNRMLLTYYGDPPMQFHPSMAKLRLLNLERDQGDRLAQVTRIVPGERILDCTAGLCADTAVLSYLTGVQGEVLGVEGSLPIYLVTKVGLANYPFDSQALAKAYQKIHLRYCDYRTLLRDSFRQYYDLIYFDPMFQAPVTSSAGIAPIRQAAIHHQLDLSDLDLAKKAVKRRIVVKSNDTAYLESLCPDEICTSKGSKIVYGIFKP